MKELKSLAVIGNTLFILWILYNAIDDGWTGARPVEAVALCTLVVLLIFNSVLLYRKGK